MITSEQQNFLLGLARQAILTALQDNTLYSPQRIDEALRVPSGAFVTLTKKGDLRGCIGFPEPIYPLYEAVIRGGVAAALQDPRFRPVSQYELKDLSIEISVLSALEEIRAEDVEVGVHGLVIEKGRARGLLLPQVPVEWGWDREQFLQHLCRKAGLPPDAWHSGAQLYAFTAHVFSEELHAEEETTR